MDTLFIKNVILMGVGWWQYQKKPNAYTKFLLKKVLHKKMIHSVRDEYTRKMLNSVGINNIINTGCPTMWDLDKKHCSKIPKNKAKNVVFTLTDYNRSKRLDSELIKICLELYHKVYFWPQGSDDYQYLKELDFNKKVYVLKPSLFSFEEFLEDKSQSVDYIGTRLHAGIKALQKFRRTIIIGIDNRAIEKSKDFNIFVIPRKKIYLLKKLVFKQIKMDIKIPESNIKKWKEQFL